MPKETDIYQRLASEWMLIGAEEGDPGDWILHDGPRGHAESLIYRMQGGTDVVLSRVAP